MAPGYRNSNPSRRQNRGLVDHDIMEGLPVRNWRRDAVTVAPPPVHDPFASAKDKWDVELPWGMPKDAHLMPQHSQDLLRAARSGRIYQKRMLVEEEDLEADAPLLLAEKTEKKEGEAKEEGFVVRTWKLVPKHLEGPEIEYLAKRRKGLRGAVVKGALGVGLTMTKMTLRRTDEQGNTYVEDVVVPEGHVVEGEVIAKTVITDPATAGVLTEGLPVPQPVKRRPPPPKRKAKGPGRGRRKKLPLPPTSVPAATGAAPVAGQTQEVQKLEPAVDANGVKVESTSATSTNGNEDTEMGDGSMIPSDDEGEGEGDDGDEASEDDDQDGEGEGEGEGSQTNDQEQRDRDRDHSNRMVLDHLPPEPKLAPPKPAISSADFALETPHGGEFGGRVAAAAAGDHGGGGGGGATMMTMMSNGSPLKQAFTPQSYSPALSDEGGAVGIGGETVEAGLGGGEGEVVRGDGRFEHHQLRHEAEQHGHYETHQHEHQHELQNQHEHQHDQQYAVIPPLMSQEEHTPSSFDVSTTDFAGMLSGTTPPSFGEQGGEGMLLDGVDGGVEGGQQHVGVHEEVGGDELPDLTDFDPHAVGVEEEGVGGGGDDVGMGEQGVQAQSQVQSQGEEAEEKFEDLLGSLEEHLNEGGEGVVGEGEQVGDVSMALDSEEGGVAAAAAVAVAVGEEAGEEGVGEEAPAQVVAVIEGEGQKESEGEIGDVAVAVDEEKSVLRAGEGEGEGLGGEGMDIDVVEEVVEEVSVPVVDAVVDTAGVAEAVAETEAENVVSETAAAVVAEVTAVDGAGNGDKGGDATIVEETTEVTATLGGEQVDINEATEVNTTEMSKEATCTEDAKENAEEGVREATTSGEAKGDPAPGTEDAAGGEAKEGDIESGQGMSKEMMEGEGDGVMSGDGGEGAAAGTGTEAEGERKQ